MFYEQLFKKLLFIIYWNEVWKKLAFVVFDEYFMTQLNFLIEFFLMWWLIDLN